MGCLAFVQRPDAAPLAIGDGESIRIMALVGSTNRSDVRSEEAKVDRITQHNNPPDIIADLSLRKSCIPIWKRVLRAGMPAATLPVYTAQRVNKQISQEHLLETCLEHIEGGVGLITIHPTARRDIIELARHRLVPWTSRGGALIIEDLLGSGGKADNVYLRILPQLATVASKRGVAISLGATFRSANVFDSNDEAQRAEIKFQTEIARELRALGCSVIIEGPGHASPSTLTSLSELMKESGCPIMPLGPIPTDSSVGLDHISAAIGAALMGLQKAAHILAAVTREEHTGGVPRIESTLEALDAAHVAARIINAQLLGTDQTDRVVATQRAAYHTCVAGKTSSGCARCGDCCPLRVGEAGE